MLQLSSDVGGTFVDVVLWDGHSDQIHVAKLPSTRHSASGILAAIDRVCGDTSVSPPDIDRFVHGFTIATNAWLERKGGRVLLVTTKGFRDVLEIGTQRRPLLYSLRQKRPAPLVPRSMVVEVDERIDAFGAIISSLTEAEISRIVRDARAAKPEAIAISLLFGYLNPIHENRLADALRAALPNVDIYTSHLINPQVEEYARTNTTATAAYVGPAVRQYVTSLRDGLAQIGLKSLMLMRSDGGIATVDATLTNPGTVLLSGPAGGVIAAAAMGTAIGVDDIVTFDMGGTSADFSLITGGRAGHSNERSIGGLPVRLPMIDIETISAGGGSIAAVDHAGSLSVGPHSAGAVPGPACYGRGGDKPTLTDATLVLGMIDPNDFAGGSVKLDVQAAHKAIAQHVAVPLGIGVEEAALGMLAVANAHMRQAIRAMTIERGHDIRRFSLAAFGGAGAIFAALMQADLGMAQILIPPRPGVFAALGLLMSDIRHNVQTSFLTPLVELRPEIMQRRLAELEQDLQKKLAADGVEPSKRHITFLADMRYVGQFHDLTLPLPENADAASLTSLFHAAHEQVYGHADPHGEVEIVSLRATGRGEIEKAAFARQAAAKGPLLAPRTHRQVRFPGMATRVEVAVYDRASLAPGHALAGPAIVSQSDCTVLILPDQEGAIDDWGVIHITTAET